MPTCQQLCFGDRAMVWRECEVFAHALFCPHTAEPWRLASQRRNGGPVMIATVHTGENMTARTDFLEFYQQLGVPANCTVDELKSAYRRRVALLHPDRHPGRDSNRVDASLLQNLTAAYDAAMSFQRSYGRLPGASQQFASRRSGGSGTPKTGYANPSADARPIRLGRILLLFGLLAILVWVFLGSSASLGHGDHPHPYSPQPTTFGPDTVIGAAAPQATMSPPPNLIVVGMDKETTRRIEGAPLSADSAHWDYGPSWIDFDDAGVSDWYSSRLRPLKVATVRPSPRATNTAAR